ncbi:uncharacterized protein LOC106719944 [Papilio machaon]|uniref:uncharacterized protein LOC106719944 n=1 Tax=Papilio machaon TaxID=76193 RepID=UPI001E662FCA|nr:uncharacterized protein LOC106719944 [Papilio machaon]XP_014369922.2 uncharacterized protein LOC106719944 [Papilio machaon]
MLTRCLLVAFVAGALSAPADEPIRVDLPVYDAPQQSNAQLSEPLVPENYPELRINKESIVDNFLSHKDTTKLAQSSPPIGSVNYGGGLFSAPVTTLEGALLETEGLGSKTLSIKENVQNVAAGIFQPKPIVDTIKEEEKYGNNGDKFYSAGRAIVSGAENVSNFVNTVLEVPVKVFRDLTRKATEKLNNFGGKLIGL